ncbi:MAG TPA: hypothetical protein VGG22_07845 [Candidatus Baltobacteraceae bacterium]
MHVLKDADRRIGRYQSRQPEAERADQYPLEFETYVGRCFTDREFRITRNAGTGTSNGADGVPRPDGFIAVRASIY